MKPRRIVWDEDRRLWAVMRVTGHSASVAVRVEAVFPTLHEAEQFVIEEAERSGE